MSEPEKQPEMVERVARAIFSKDNCPNDEGWPLSAWDELVDRVKDNYREQARAAIEAMRLRDLAQTIADAVYDEMEDTIIGYASEYAEDPERSIAEGRASILKAVKKALASE